MEKELNTFYDLVNEYKGKFRVGDILRITREEYDLKKGTHLTITKIGKMKVSIEGDIEEKTAIELEWTDHRGEVRQEVFYYLNNDYFKIVVEEYMGFKAGDTVRLKSDQSILMTVIDIEIEKENPIHVQWFDRRGELQYHYFAPINLAHANTMAKIPIYKAKDFEFYGLKIYSSLLANSFGKTDMEAEKATRFVYNFKKEGRNKTEVAFSVDLAKKMFECETVVSVPSRSPAPNELQKMFGQIITRLEELPPRKYAHKKPLVSNYEHNYRIDFDRIKGKILLIDDVITSGETINHFANRLEKEGFEVVKFALGLDHKLEPYAYKEVFYA